MAKMFGIRDLTLLPDVAAAVFEEFIKRETPSVQHWPGLNSLILKGERGDRLDRYLFVLEFETVQTRTHYFPTLGVYSHAAQQLFMHMGDFVAEWERYATFANETVLFTDYEVMADFGIGFRSTDDPCLGRVFGLHYIALRSGVTLAAFENFLHHSQPVLQLPPGVRIYLCKGERGDRVGRLLLISEFENVATRNQYFPTAISPSAIQAHLPTMADFVTEWQRYATFPHESVLYTDYVVFGQY